MQETIKYSWPCAQNSVQISEQFAVRDLIKVYNRSEVYLVLRLSQGGVQLYRAMNNAILEEVQNDDFPFKENPHYNTQTEKKGDAKLADNLVREFLNKVDKALVKVHNETNLSCVVIATEDNYSRLMQVADKPNLYHGYCAINYNADAPHQIVAQSWEMVVKMQYERRTAAIEAMREAVASGSVLTDLQDIYQAAIDGRADVLIVHEDYNQPVLMTSERTFDYIDDVSIPNAIDDVVSVIAWEVVSKKGRVIFTQQEQIKDLGPIVLKTRF